MDEPCCIARARRVAPFARSRVAALSRRRSPCDNGGTATGPRRRFEPRFTDDTTLRAFTAPVPAGDARRIAGAGTDAPHRGESAVQLHREGQADRRRRRGRRRDGAPGPDFGHDGGAALGRGLRANAGRQGDVSVLDCASREPRAAVHVDRTDRDQRVGDLRPRRLQRAGEVARRPQALPDRRRGQ